MNGHRSLLIVLFAVCLCCDGAKILGIVPFGTSHYFLGNKLMRGLADAGHDVTVVSPYEDKVPTKNGSYTSVVLEGLDDVFNELKSHVNAFETGNKNIISSLKKGTRMFSKVIDVALANPKVKELLNSNQKFDAVIMEQFMNDAFKYLAYHYQCPLILLVAGGPGMLINSAVGNPTMLAYDPGFINIKGTEMTFLEKVGNVFTQVGFDLMNKFYILPEQNDILHKTFPDAPDLSDIYYNVSLVLLNSHVSTSIAVPLVPNMVEIAGYHIDPPKKLPKDLQDFLDSATDGVVYFSMGSNLESKYFPKERRDVFLNVFGRLKQKVLWKFEDEVLPGQPDNVVIRKWLPQQDILAHPNVKLFITHGGRLSTIENIYHGVPILAIPVFGDQFGNADKAVRGGYALKLSYHDSDFTEQRLEELIGELVTNPKYAEVAKHKSMLFHDRPMSPKETIAYWVDYVIRHKGAEHLRVKGINMPFYEYFLLDVLAFVLAVIVLVIYVIRFAFRKVCSCFKKKQAKVKQN